MEWLFLRLFSFFELALPRGIRQSAIGNLIVALLTVVTVIYPIWAANALWRFYYKNLSISELIRLLSLGLF